MARLWPIHPTRSPRCLNPHHPLTMDSETYIPGMGCTCCAYDASECGCPGVDWTPSEVYRLRATLDKATGLAGELIACIRINHLRGTFASASREEIEEWLKPWLARLESVRPTPRISPTND
jgi:hypothetical protein